MEAGRRLRIPGVGATGETGAGGARGRRVAALRPAARRTRLPLRRIRGRAGPALRPPPRRRAAASRSGLPVSAAGGPRPLLRGQSRFPLERRRLEGPAARALRLLRASRRHLHARGNLRRDHPAPAATGRSGSDRGGADAGRAVSRHAQLGLRRRRALRGTELLRRPRGAQAPGRRLPCTGARRGARRRLQPSRPGGELPAGVRSVLHGSIPNPLGRSAQLRRARQRRGPAVLPRERVPLDRRVSFRRPAHRRRARHPRSLRAPLSRRADRSAS